MVQAEQVKDHRVPVVNADGIPDHPVAELVGRTVTCPAFEITAGRPDCEAFIVMISAGSTLSVRSPTARNSVAIKRRAHPCGESNGS